MTSNSGQVTGASRVDVPPSFGLVRPRPPLQYSLDPSLSRTRHADPDYVDSSDPMDISSETVFEVPVLPSSPPKDDHMEVDVGRDDDEMTTDDDAGDQTDDDETSGRVIRGARGETTITAATSFTQRAAHSTSSALMRPADDAIEALFNGAPVEFFNYSYQDFREIPHKLHDLLAFEDLGQRQFKVLLSHNLLTYLDRSFYDFRNLSFLSLRYNSIRELSASVGKLRNLRELQLGNNELETLPMELLTLPELQILEAYPNSNLLEAPRDGSCEEWLVRDTPISLQEHASRTVCQLAMTDYEYTATVLNQLEPRTRPLTEPALNAARVGRICSLCSGPVVKAVAVHRLWAVHRPLNAAPNGAAPVATPTNSFHGHESVPYQTSVLPFQSLLCSMTCLHKYRMARAAQS